MAIDQQSRIACQNMPLNIRAVFCRIFYPIRTQERLPEHQYDAHFFQGCLKNRVLTRNKGSRSQSRCEHGEACEAVGDLPLWLIQRDADARSCSLVLAPLACTHSTPARFTSPRYFLAVDCQDDDASGLSQTPAPAAAPARATHHASHRVRRC
jgi:hypothetical protein